MIILKKISQLIIPDVIRIYLEKDIRSDSISTKMHQHLLTMPDLQVLFGSGEDFYINILFALLSEDTKDFYKQMSLHRAYLKFFWDSGPYLNEQAKGMIEQHWPALLNLEKLLEDAKAFCQSLFDKQLRINKPIAFSCCIGLFAQGQYEELSAKDKLKFENKLPRHVSGQLSHHLALLGDLSITAMLDYDMPVICGPSGATAMRLALGRQAGLSTDEMSLLQFAIAMYHVGVNAHSIDETFSIASQTNFNHYVRGDYRSIFPVTLQKSIEFELLWKKISIINKHYQSVLQPPKVTTSILALRNERHMRNK